MTATSALLQLSQYLATDDDLPEIFGAPNSAAPPSPIYNFELQAARWLEGLRTRDCDPVAPSHLHEELQLRLDEGERVGYGFVLPASKDVSVVPIVPKSQQENAEEIAA